MFNFCDKICRALGHKIGIHFSKNSEINYDEMEYYANGVNRKYERPEKDKSDDMEISMQQYLALNISNKRLCNQKQTKFIKIIKPNLIIIITFYNKMYQKYCFKLSSDWRIDNMRKTNK